MQPRDRVPEPARTPDRIDVSEVNHLPADVVYIARVLDAVDQLTDRLADAFPGLETGSADLTTRGYAMLAYVSQRLTADHEDARQQDDEGVDRAPWVSAMDVENALTTLLMAATPLHDLIPQEDNDE